MAEDLPGPDRARFPALTEEHLVTLPGGSWLGRLYFSTGPYPVRWNEFRSFGPARGRFDHHPPPPRSHPDRAVLYTAPPWRTRHGSVVPSLKTCLAEVFRDAGTIDARAGAPRFTAFRLARPVQLLDLADSLWVTEAGANAAIASGSRQRSRAWARAISDHYPGLDGLTHASSHVPAARVVTLWEGAMTAVPAHWEFDRALTDGAMRAALEQYAGELGLDLEI